MNLDEFVLKYSFNIKSIRLGGPQGLNDVLSFVKSGIDNSMNSEYYNELCDMLIQLKQDLNAQGSDLLFIEVGQFYSASIGLNILMSQKNFLKMYDLVVKAFSTGFVTTKENRVEYEKIEHWCRKGILNLDMLLSFLHPLFYYDTYYSGVFSHMTDDFYDKYEEVLFDQFYSLNENIVEDLSIYLSWCVKHNEGIFDKETKINKIIEAVDNKVFNERKTIILGILLITEFGIRAGVNINEKGIELYEEYSSSLGAHEGLQILTSVVSNNPIAINEYKDVIIEEVNKYETFLSNLKLDSFNYFMEKSKIFENIFSVFILTSLRADDTQLSKELLAHWKNMNVKKLESTLLIFPNTEKGVQLGNTSACSSNHKESFSKVIATENECLQLHALDNISHIKTVLKRANRFGQPIESKGYDFERALLNFYCFDEWNLSEGYKNYISFDQAKHPLQPLMLKKVGFTLPFLASSNEVQVNRTILNVLLWYSGETFTSNLECEVMKSICDHYNISLKYVNGDDLDAPIEKFNEYYESDTFDIIFLSSHGEVDHFDPKKSEVLIGKGTFYDLRNLKQSLNVKKRILFLNVCDACSSFSMGADGGLSFGSELVSGSQSIIGHLWPVHPLYAVFGSIIFLDKCLSGNGDFFEGYTESLKIMIDGKNSLVSYFDAPRFLNLSEKVNNSSIDYGSIVNWGTLIYLE